MKKQSWETYPKIIQQQMMSVVYRMCLQPDQYRKSRNPEQQNDGIFNGILKPET